MKAFDPDCKRAFRRKRPFLIPRDPTCRIRRARNPTGSMRPGFPHAAGLLRSSSAPPDRLGRRASRPVPLLAALTRRAAGSPRGVAADDEPGAFSFPFFFFLSFTNQRAQGAELNKRRRDGMSRKRAKKACRHKAAGGIALHMATRRFRFSTRRLCAEQIPFCNAVRPSKPPLQSVRKTLSPDNRQFPEIMRPARRQEETACSLRAPPCGKQKNE